MNYGRSQRIRATKHHAVAAAGLFAHDGLPRPQERNLERLKSKGHIQLEMKNSRRSS